MYCYIHDPDRMMARREHRHALKMKQAEEFDRKCARRDALRVILEKARQHPDFAEAYKSWSDLGGRIENIGG